MSEILHTSVIRVIGGRNGRTESPDGNLDVQLRRPGTGQADDPGTNPEQLFAAAYAACFAGAMGAVARRDGVTLGEIVIDSETTLIKYADMNFGIAVRIDVQSAGDIPDDMLRANVRDAHTICPYSRAIAGNVEVTLLVKGAPV